MINIEGLEDLEKVLEEFDGELTAVSFDPEDPVSIRDAIKTMEKAVDGKLEKYSKNKIFKELINKTKEEYRAAILEKASEARIKGRDEEE